MQRRARVLSPKKDRGPSSGILEKMEEKRPKRFLARFFKALGPGFITGASDDDPSGIATYAQTGARFGYHQLWTSVFFLPFMVAIQEMCGRIGMVTGKGLARVIKSHYTKSSLYFTTTLLLVANTVNIGADLGAMAAAGQLLFDIPFIWWLVGLTVLTLFLEVFVSYPRYAKFLKYLTLSLFAYVATVFVVKQDWGTILQSTFIPHVEFSKVYLINIVALLGTTISPYLFFWQADEEVEEEVAHHKIRSMGKGIPHITRRDLSGMRLDTSVGMIFSNLITFFIIATAASTLFAHGITTIETADQAALALRPFAGDFAFLLFALGIIGTGLLAVPVLAGSASYAVAEMMNWTEGLGKKFTQAHGFYGVITVATLIGLLVNFTPIAPFQMLYYTAVLNGICVPPLIVFILLIANNKKIMGMRTNSRLSNVFGWLVAGLTAVAAGALLFSFFW